MSQVQRLVLIAGAAVLVFLAVFPPLAVVTSRPGSALIASQVSRFHPPQIDGYSRGLKVDVPRLTLELLSLFGAAAVLFTVTQNVGPLRWPRVGFARQAAGKAPRKQEPTRRQGRGVEMWFTLMVAILFAAGGIWWLVLVMHK